MSVVAKLFVAEVKRQAGSPDAVQVILNAVTRGEENRTWAEASPCGSFTMTIQNPSAAVQFKLGREFYVTFDVATDRAALDDDHEYVPSDYEQQHPEQTHHRCQACGAKKASHDEPLRSQFRDWRP